MVVNNLYIKLKDKYYQLFIYLPELSDNWRRDFIILLEKEYNDKDCYMCKAKVPCEGIVLRKQSLFSYEAYKLKSADFLLKETKDLDDNVIDLETQQTEI